jgi:hypothetical protein
MFVSNNFAMYYLLKPIEDLFVWSFGILENLGNLPNNAFIVSGFVLMFYWLYLQGKFNKEAANNPNQIK